jgi:hypothetical protein
MNARPLAYHITFGTYGTRLHGDARGTIDRRMNQYGDPIVGSDRSWWHQERARLKFPPVEMSPEKMRYAESVLPSICERGGWGYHVGAAGPDHVHSLLTAEADGDAVRMWFKRWLGEALSSQWRLPDGATWWAEGGSVKWVWTDDYLDDVFNYVDGQRASGRTRPRKLER